jgi:hypothetical protein
MEDHVAEVRDVHVVSLERQRIGVVIITRVARTQAARDVRALEEHFVLSARLLLRRRERRRGPVADFELRRVAHARADRAVRSRVIVETRLLVPVPGVRKGEEIRVDGELRAGALEERFALNRAVPLVQDHGARVPRRFERMISVARHAIRRRSPFTAEQGRRADGNERHDEDGHKSREATEQRGRLWHDGRLTHVCSCSGKRAGCLPVQQAQI